MSAVTKYFSWLSISALVIALAIILGAFGAHGLKDILDEYSKAVYEKATFYHFANGLGLLIVATITPAPKHKNWICGLLLLGITVFSGSLYLLAITGIKILGAITPIGGMTLIIAWLLLAISKR
jgi:uncharacterized membrane protein YgdD (TMEM256/DUF423 family)